MSLPSIIQSIGVFRATAIRLAADFRRIAALPDIPVDVRQDALASAQKIDDFLASSEFVNISTNVINEVKNAFLSGKSIVSHQPTDTF